MAEKVMGYSFLKLKEDLTQVEFQEEAYTTHYLKTLFSFLKYAS